MKTLLLIGSLLFMQTTWSKKLQFEKTTFRGSGCKKGTTSTIVSPDGKVLSILFDDFSVEVPQFDGDNDNDSKSGKFNENLDHKKCNIIVKTDVPEGEVIESVSLDFDIRGASYIEDNAHIRFFSKLMGWQGKKKRYNGHKRGQTLAIKHWHAYNVEEDWIISDRVRIPINTACHKRNRNKVKFIMENVLMAFINKRGGGGDGMAFSTIDSQDLGGKLNFRINTRPCNKSGEMVVSAPKKVKKPRKKRRNRYKWRI